VLALLTHLVDLEQRVRESERRGELKPVSDVGEVIRQARKRQGLTAEALAELADVGVGTLHKVESGNLTLQAPKLIQITQALGLELLVSTR
jgi:ribosome-binding protein aMBF1 (putative translation factor)